MRWGRDGLRAEPVVHLAVTRTVSTAIHRSGGRLWSLGGFNSNLEGAMSQTGTDLAIKNEVI